MSGARRVSPFEWAYASAAPYFPPYAIRLQVEGEGPLAAPALRAALDLAQAANPWSGMRLRGHRWEPGARASLHEGEPGAHAPPGESVEVWRAGGLLFRCSHALMDARGLLFFAEEVFRALRGEALLGSSAAGSDHAYLRAFDHPRAREWPPPDRRSPVAAGGEIGFVWESRTVPGQEPAAGARLAFALAELAWRRDDRARIMLPVDLRQLDPGLRSVANFSSPILLDLPRGTSWEEFYRRVLEAFARHDYRGVSAVDRLIPYLPRALLGGLQAKLQRWQEKRDRYVLSGTASHVGRVELARFSAPGFSPRALRLLPFDAPGSACTLISVQHDHALEIAASAAACSREQLTTALDFLLERFAATRAGRSLPQRAAEGVRGPAQEWRNALAQFSEQVRRWPDRVAVSEGSRALTYAELDQLSARAAGALRARGVGPGDRVAVIAKRSPELVASLLGIWRAGASFVPCDPGWPASRIELVVRDSGARLTIAEPLFGEADPRVTEGAEAYVLYTSGSTGAPKGVVVAHGSLGNYLTWARVAYDPGAPAVYPLFTSLAFDLTLTALLVPLVSGGEVRVIAEADPLLAARAILQHSRVNCAKLTPSHLRLFREVGGGALRVLVVGGEALDPALAAAFPGARVFNEYGPTEATVGCVVHEFDPAHDGAVVPIGRPIANAEVLLLDHKAGAVEPGEIGEIYLSGACLAVGYHNRPGEDARFSPHPFRGGERVYRTGDRALLRDDGNFIYHGRVDDQLKIRGHRVEPGEVEGALLATGLCRDAAVVGRDGRLVAYVSGAGEEAEIREALGRRLPRALRPDLIVRLPQLPLTNNGKVDKRQLPTVAAAAGAPAEKGLEGKLEALLGEPIAPDRSLHELGFDSLRMALLLTKAAQLLPENTREAFFKDLAVFLKDPTMDQLADYLRAKGAAD